MKTFDCFSIARKLEHCCSKSRQTCIRSSFRFLVYHVNAFWIRLTYFLTLSLLGFLALKLSNPRSTTSSTPKDLDIFFTSVSAATVSSMSAVEMEAFSEAQLIIMTLLMLLGGEVFTSMLGLQFARCQFPKHDDKESNHNPSYRTNCVHQTQLELVSTVSESERQTFNTDLEWNISSTDHERLKYSSIKCLGYVVLGYLLMAHFGGASFVAMYTSRVPSAREVLANKGLRIQTFSLFTTVSTFSNCGFVPTNENMLVFKKNSGLLLLLIPQILLGNTLYPPCLRFLIWVLEKITRREEFRYILTNTKEMSYSHLVTNSLRSFLLFGTVIGFILVQLILFCFMEWSSGTMDGLNSYQKLVAALFQVTNSRHAGENVFDLSIISPAVLVLFVVMMYLPPHTSFLPMKQHRKEEEEEGGGAAKVVVSRRWEYLPSKRVECLLFSQLSYLAIFTILICITERHKMKTDPLNFNVLNVTIEVISAYGNVGLSSGYSCERRVNPDGSFCKEAWYGFAGRWSNMGKFILILVMFFGRLKTFTLNAGKAWNRSS